MLKILMDFKRARKEGVVRIKIIVMRLIMLRVNKNVNFDSMQ